MGLADSIRESGSTESKTSGPTNIEVIEAVNRQTKAVNGLKAYLTEAIRDEVRSASRTLRQPSTSPQPAVSPQKLESVESRLSEIELTLKSVLETADGSRLNDAVERLTAEANRSQRAGSSATERAAKLLAENNTLVKSVHGAARRIEATAVESIQRAADETAGVVTAKVEESKSTAERVIAAANKVSGRMSWAALGAFALALVPIATVCACVLLLLLGATRLGAWVLDVASHAGPAWAQGLVGLAACVGVIGVCWLVLAAASWLEAKMTDAFRRLR